MYYLASHAYICATDHHWLFLDLSTDRYFAVDRAQMATIQRSLYGFHPQATVDPITDADEISLQGNSLLSDLVSSGVITPDADRGKAMRPLHVPVAADTLICSKSRRSLAAFIVNFPRVAISLSVAHKSLNQETLLNTVRRVAKAKAAAEDPRTTKAVSMDQIASLIATFNAIRPLFPRDYRCLFDSLALLEFLIPMGAGVEWIFGVATDPFSAHCWLQRGNMVLNDSLEAVAGYTPILRV